VQRKAGGLSLELIHGKHLELGELELSAIREQARLLGTRLRVESTPDSLTLRLALPVPGKLKAS
jgi:hypothetical protein